MSLMLLPTSRAFRKMQDQPGRYNLSQQGLPKFGRAKPPEPDTPACERAPVPVLIENQKIAPPRPVTNEPVQYRIMKKTKNVFSKRTDATELAVEAATPVASPASAPVAKRRFFFSGWSLFRNPFKRGVKSKTPAPSGPAQPELWLDRVKPLRNDLSDSDIEVVAAAKPVAAPAPAPIAAPAAPTIVTPPPVAPNPEPAEARWSEIRRQFLGTGKP